MVNTKMCDVSDPIGTQAKSTTTEMCASQVPHAIALGASVGWVSQSTHMPFGQSGYITHVGSGVAGSVELAVVGDRHLETATVRAPWEPTRVSRTKKFLFLF